MSKEENKENIDTKKLLEMSLDDIVKMNTEKRRKNNISFKKKFRNNYNKRQYNKSNNKNNNNNNKRIRGGNHFRKKNNKNNTNYNKYYNKFDIINRNKNYEKETRTKIEIINLQKEIKDDELNKFFSSVGKIKSCIIQKDENNNSLGIANIEYYNPESAKEAITNFDNAEIEGTFMKVQYKN